MPTTPPSMTPTPTNLPQRGQRSTFSGYLDDFIAWLPTGVTDFGAATANVYSNTVEAFNSAATAVAAAISAMASANLVVWVSGTTYSQYSVVVSPLSKIAYRKVSTSTGGTTDPSMDATYTNWRPLYGPGDHEVSVSSGNGCGSTATKIARYTTINRNVGSAITYADSAANGATFTINETALYSIHLRGYVNSTGSKAGISVNTTTPTASPDVADGVIAYTAVGTQMGSVTRVARLVAGDVVRAHGIGAGEPTAGFSITKVS